MIQRQGLQKCPVRGPVPERLTAQLNSRCVIDGAARRGTSRGTLVFGTVDF